MKLAYVLKNIIKKFSVDYVVEQGTSDIWTYRKWKSGIAECWGTSKPTVTGWTTWYVLYESNTFYKNYPSGLFTEEPTLTAAAQAGTGNTAACGLEMHTGGSATRTPTMYILRPNNPGSSSIGFRVNLYAIGKWK